jgi:hypothetical protein
LNRSRLPRTNCRGGRRLLPDGRPSGSWRVGRCLG